MFHKLLFILFLNNTVLFVIGYSECDEYIIIVKEYTCGTKLVPIVRPITLKDIDASCLNSTDIASYDETNVNKSYVIKFDYNNSESICVPVMKYMDLLPSITIPDDDPLPGNITHEAMEFNDTEEVENINKTATNIDLFYVNDFNSKPEIVNNKIYSNHLLQCVYTDNICLNENFEQTSNTDDADDSITHNLTTNTIIAVLKNGSITEQTTDIDNYINTITDFNCSIGNTKTISDDQIIAVTYDLIKRYNCRNKSIDKLNNETNVLPRYNLTVYAANDFILTNAQFCSVYNDTFKIACNVNNITRMTKNNVTVDDIDVTNKKFSMSMIWHCELLNLNYTIENIRILTNLRLSSFQNCTEDYANANKSNDVKSSVIILKKDNHTRDEDEKLFNNSPLKIQLVPGNNSDEAVILNFTKGRFFNLLTNDEEKNIRYYSSFVELEVPNYVNNNTKFNANGDPIELDIIFNNEENTNQTEVLIKNLIEASFNSSKREIINCMYSNSTASLTSSRNETKSKFICKIINQDDYKPASVLNSRLDVPDNNLKDNVTSTTEKIDREQSTTTTPKTNAKDAKANYSSTTETNLLGKSLGMGNYTGESDPYDDPSYISPRVYITIVVSIIGVVASVGTYAYFIFRRPKHKYEPAASRDWEAMDETAF